MSTGLPSAENLASKQSEDQETHTLQYLQEREEFLTPRAVQSAVPPLRFVVLALQLASAVCFIVGIATPAWFVVSVVGVDTMSVGVFQHCNMIQQGTCSFQEKMEPKEWMIVTAITSVVSALLTVLGLGLTVANAYISWRGKRNLPLKLAGFFAVLLAAVSLTSSLSVANANVDSSIHDLGVPAFFAISRKIGYSFIFLISCVILQAIAAAGYLFDIVMSQQKLPTD